MNPSTFNQICWGTQSYTSRVFGRDTDLPYDVLPQKDYRAAMKFEQQLPIQFRRNGLGFVLLRDAFIEELKGLEGGNKEAFVRAAEMAMKQHFRLSLHGYKTYDRQFTARRSAGNHTGSITVAKLVMRVAKEIHNFLEKAGNPAELPFDRLVLIELRHVSKSSWQPC